MYLDTTPCIISEINKALSEGAYRVTCTYIGNHGGFVGIRSIPKHWNSLPCIEERIYEVPLLREPAELLWAIIQQLKFEQFSGNAELGREYVVIDSDAQWRAVRKAVDVASKQIHCLVAAGTPLSLAEVVSPIQPFKPPTALDVDPAEQIEDYFSF
ncbi:hypothetical protein SAMN06265337_1303 [Hymenobacter gelipurpurascens]|uniref:Uncharacterized protein n=1 Tax=Hymenobacter gelipurpurascens TaxID=89968 RepID=A0A212THM8_9BACT|nr:hypothetical protein [Hymenobacter gelipurpurascens]SNC65475.1 hypothetical protein SAMN06265337_1303 [Hymenobacter gelipurpurascens]